MLKEKALFKRFVKSGPGGMKCACCFPQTNPGKKATIRSYRGDERRFIERLIKEALE